MSKTTGRNRKLLVVLLAIVVGMFGFGYVLIPIYRLMANIYGFGGEMHASQSERVNARKQFKQVQQKGVVASRWVDVQFIVIDNIALKLEFHPMSHQLRLHPGEVKEVKYIVKNLSDKKMLVQALPAITPDRASKYLARDECDCFDNQTLKPGESREMPVKVAIDQGIPGNIHVLTLSYRLIEKKQRVDSSVN